MSFLSPDRARTFKRIAKGLLTGVSTLTGPATRGARSLYRAGLELEFMRDWAIEPFPEWFDHEYDLAMFYKWRRPHFFERGVYASEVCGKKRVLDLCCGEGSVSALFLAPLASEVVAVDFDTKAIDLARRRWTEFSNIRFETQDIRALDVPAASFDVVCWDNAIEHFTQKEMDAIFAGIKRALSAHGIMHGSTIRRGEQAGHHEHEYEFETTEELTQFLARYFKHVAVWQRSHPDRASFYFRCSDSVPVENGRQTS